MMVWVTVPLVFPQSSVAFQLLVSLSARRPAPPVVVAPRSCTVAPPHVSLAVGAVKVGEAGHSTVPLLPCPLIVGGVGYTSTMVWLTVPLVFPQSSVAFQLLVEV